MSKLKVTDQNICVGNLEFGSQTKISQLMLTKSSQLVLGVTKQSTNF